MKHIQKFDSQINVVGVTCIFPTTKREAMLVFETDKTEYVFVLENRRAINLAVKIIHQCGDKQLKTI